MSTKMITIKNMFKHVKNVQKVKHNFPYKTACGGTPKQQHAMSVMTTLFTWTQKGAVSTSDDKFRSVDVQH